MVDELRKVQKVGHSTLTVSVPKAFARELGLSAGDSLLVRAESDGTLRLIPSNKSKETSKAVIRADQAGGDEMLARLIVSAYALGYDTIEVAGKAPLSRATLDRVMETMARLRGMEVVESDQRRIVGQSFTDPTKFPVDSLIKRLQMLVSQSLDYVMESLELAQAGTLNEVARVQQQIEELYWLILRQLLIALDRRELASEIGIESPLHASGDRVSAKALDEIGLIIREIAEELVGIRSSGKKMDQKMTASLRKLASRTREAFNTTVDSLLSPDIGLIGSSQTLVEDVMRMERAITRDMQEAGQYGFARVLVSQFGQLARYCNIIIEIASHRLLRRTTRVATVEK